MGVDDAFWMIAPTLVVIGAINWGLIGVTGLVMDQPFNLVQTLSMGSQMVEYGIYTLVGIAGLASIGWLLPE